MPQQQQQQRSFWPSNPQQMLGVLPPNHYHHFDQISLAAVAAGFPQQQVNFFIISKLSKPQNGQKQNVKIPKWSNPEC